MGKPFSVKDYRPWLYFGLTFLWSWAFLLPPVFLGLAADAFPVAILRALAGAGPMLVTLFLLFTRLTRIQRSEYGERLFSFLRIRPVWWIVTLLGVPAITLLAAGLDWLLGGSGLKLEAAARFVESPLSIVPFGLFILAFGPFPEEMGWRGYALPGLQASMAPVAASLLLGTTWALWHLPLFFIPGTYQAGLGVLTPAFWWFMLGMIPQSVLITWVFNHCHGSTLSAVLLHFSTNLTGESFALSARGDLFSFLLWCLIATLTVL
ncbi:MAG: CPBP family intramembrane metalloprotease [Anaerolineae bacterium]|nr:CPBP family intramembrane metalloprotease [Anaerolineae bacterium]